MVPTPTTRNAVVALFAAGSILVAATFHATYRGSTGGYPYARFLILAERLVALAACWAFAGLAIYAACRKSTQLRLLRGLRKIPIARLRPGLAKVSGMIGRDGPVLVSPLTGRRCVYYRFGARVEPVEDEETPSMSRSLGLPCYLGDGTGRVSLDPVHTNLELSMVQLRTGDSDPAEVDRLRIMLRDEYNFHDRPDVLSEYILRVGQTVLVVGMFDRDALGYRLIRGGRLNLLTERTEAELDACWEAELTLYGLAAACLIGFGLSALGGLMTFLSALLAVWPALWVALSDTEEAGMWRLAFIQNRPPIRAESRGRRAERTVGAAGLGAPTGSTSTSTHTASTPPR